MHHSDMIKAPRPRGGEITPYCNIREKKMVYYDTIKMNGEGFLLAMRNDLVKAKGKSDFKDAVFKYAHFMPKQCFLLIDELFGTSQPKYKEYFVECMKMYIDLTRWNSKETIVEFNQDYTKIRIL